MLFAALFLLATGTARLLRERPLLAQLAAATLAVWNPYVAERLVLGQWPLLLACAAFPWLIDALGGKGRPRWSVAALALAATALTPATGVMGVVLGVIAAWRRGIVGVVLLAALVNAPWIVAGLLHSSISRSDPAAVGLFDLQSEGHFGRLGSALTLGGIWNTEVVPTSRTLLLTVLIAVVVGAVMIVGGVTMWRDDGRLLAVLCVAGAIGLAIALAGWLAPDLVARVVADVPAGGLIRDGTRWLALLVPLEAVAFGAGVHTILYRAEFTAWEVPVIVFALVLPLAAMPDLAWGVGGRLEPATYPAAWTDARRVIETTDVRGDILVLPFSSYRRPSWNHDTSVLDPAGRFFDRTTVTNDDLVVSGRTIKGEDPRAARIQRELDGKDVTRGLARQGIGLVVVETDAPGARAALRKVRGARELDVKGDSLRVFAISGARAQEVDEDDRQIMIATWIDRRAHTGVRAGGNPSRGGRTQTTEARAPELDESGVTLCWLVILRGLEGGQQRGNTYRRHHRLHRWSRSGRSNCRGRRPDAAERRREADLIDERELRLQQLIHASRRDEGRAPRSPPFVRPGLLLPPERLDDRCELPLRARPRERAGLLEGATAQELAPFVVLDQSSKRRDELIRRVDEDS